MNTFRDLGAETGDTELETSLGHIMRPCLKKNKQKSRMATMSCFGDLGKIYTKLRGLCKHNMS